jgi:hypothetical protein
VAGPLYLVKKLCQEADDLYRYRLYEVKGVPVRIAVKGGILTGIPKELNERANIDVKSLCQ